MKNLVTVTFESLTLAKEISFTGNDFRMITNLFINRTMNREYEIAEYYSTLQDLSLDDIEKIYMVVCNLIKIEEQDASELDRKNNDKND